MTRTVLMVVSLLAAAGPAAADTLEGGPDLVAVDVAGGFGVAVGHAGELWTLEVKRGLWRREPSLTQTALHDVFVVNPKEVWVVGFGGLFLHFDGHKWDAPAGSTSKSFYAVALANRKRGLALGDGGRVRHWLGEGWQGFGAMTVKPSFRSVTRVGRGGKERFVAVGIGGAAIAFTGVGRSLSADVEITGIHSDLLRITACDSRVAEAVAVGQGAALRDKRGTWRVLPAPPRPLTSAIVQCKRGAVERVIATGGAQLAVYDVATRAWSDRAVGEGATVLRDIAWIDSKRFLVVGDGGFWAMLPR